MPDHAPTTAPASRTQAPAQPAAPSPTAAPGRAPAGLRGQPLAAQDRALAPPAEGAPARPTYAPPPPRPAGSGPRPEAIAVEPATAEATRASQGDITAEERTLHKRHRGALGQAVAQGVGPDSARYVGTRWSELLHGAAGNDAAAGLVKVRVAGGLAQSMAAHMAEGNEATRKALAEVGAEAWSGWVTLVGSGSPNFQLGEDAWARTQKRPVGPEAAVEFFGNALSGAVEVLYARLEHERQGAGGAPGHGARRDRALHETTLSRHAMIEYFAHHVAYEETWDEKGARAGLPERYTFDVLADPASGFKAVYARAHQQSGYPPVLAFAGTNDLLDVLTDLDPNSETGLTQFASVYRGFKRQVIDKVRDPRVILTGHSLGGALAQFAAAVYGPEGFSFAELVTFNAPGLPRQLVQHFRAFRSGQSPDKRAEVTHYTRAEDPVSRAGQANLPGTGVKLHSPDLARQGDVGGAHTRLMIQGSRGAHALIGSAEIGDEKMDDRDRAQIDAARRKLGALAQYLVAKTGIDPRGEFGDWGLDKLNARTVYVALTDAAGVAEHIIAAVQDVLPHVRALRDPALRRTLKQALSLNLAKLLRKIREYLPLAQVVGDGGAVLGPLQRLATAVDAVPG